MHIKVGIDSGFSQIKFVFVNPKTQQKEHYVFPAAVARPSAFELESDRGYPTLENMAIEYGRSQYYIGEKAIRETGTARFDQSADKFKHTDDVLKFLAVFGWIIDKFDIDNATFDICTGLPVFEFKNYRKDFIKMLKNAGQSFHFHFNGKSISAKVENVYVIPQSAGAYYDAILEDGQLLSFNDTSNKAADYKDFRNMEQYKSVTMDIGYRTTDGAVIDQGNYVSAESFTLEIGVKNVLLELRRIIQAKHNYTNIKIPDLLKFARQGYIRLSGEEIDITGYLTEASRPYVEQIRAETQSYISDFRTIDYWVFTGGGAIIMQDAIKEVFGEHIKFLKNLEFNNAMGYLEYLLLKTA